MLALKRYDKFNLNMLKIDMYSILRRTKKNSISSSQPTNCNGEVQILIKTIIFRLN